MTREIYLEYKENGVFTDIISATLESEDGTYGVKRIPDNTVILNAGAIAEKRSTGLYFYEITVDPNTLYEVVWKVQVREGEDFRYFIDQIGPFNEETTIRAVADQRGQFNQSTRAVLFLRVSDQDGDGVNPELISCDIQDSTGVSVFSGTPEKVSDGFYAFDWDISLEQPVGQYRAIWDYTVDGTESTELQEIVVTAYNNPSTESLYSPRLQELRLSLTYMIACAQSVLVRREPAQTSRDLQRFDFSFPRWNQSGVKIYRNDRIVEDGVEVDFFKGRVTFDNRLTKYDRIEASYTFRWFKDEEIDRFLSNSLGILNSFPPVGYRNLYTVEDRNIPAILYGAAVDALRQMMLCLQFQQPQLVFGGAEAAGKVFSNLESIKKNYEETWNRLLDQKKNGPYKGLTKMIVTPEFALPGGRSRWFRYMFSSGT